MGGRKKVPYITVEKPTSGSGVEHKCFELVNHAKRTGHGINDVIAELSWQWFKSSQPTADDK